MSAATQDVTARVVADHPSATPMEHAFKIVIVGAGPAGIAAAIAATSQGQSVAVIDDNAAAGGQIWRRGLSHEHDSSTAQQRRLLQQFAACGATVFAGRRVVTAPRPGVLDTWHDGEEAIERFRYEKLIVATGARERFLPFPGWTLPGVYGAGGLQALVRGGYSVRGKRVIVAGTGPLLLAVAAHLKQDGATVAGLYEQAPLGRLLRFGLRLWKRPAKVLQAIQLGLQLRSVRTRRGCWPVAAHGITHLEAVTLTDGRRTWTEPCDALACGFHLVSNVELPALLGCRTESGRVVVDSLQRTSTQHVFCVGETAGVAGLDAALLEGRVAGFAASGAATEARKLSKRVGAERSFARAMDRAFALRPELARLCKPDTVLCRCEDVRHAEIASLLTPENTWTDAKLQTRCGMGPCQGRICGPILEALFGVRNESVRPPIFPIPIAALACELSAAPELQPAQETR